MKPAAVFLLLLTTASFGQSPQVPHKMQFAGITLSIRDDARREIQKDVDAMTQYPKYFNAKVERARTYFPIIEKVFEQERVPDDFKYLVLQESALISDAVSTSNAVGFWQFKDFTAIEMGLRVDKEIDERMNIEASSRAAANYMKKNNYYFNNWIYALQAYQMGAGAVMKSVKDYESGTKHMEITSKTYWYVKKFLAHKVAYEDAVKGPASIKVIPVVNQSRKSLSDLACEFALPEEELKAYNTWVRSSHIPGDRTYTVFIPTAGDNFSTREALAKNHTKSKQTDHSARVEARPAMAGNETVMLNGIPAMKAQPGETITAFTRRAEVNLSLFLKSNDLSITDKLNPGVYYYLKRKKTRASQPSHIVVAGETLWAISQQYGVHLRKLQRYNRDIDLIKLKEGTRVWLTTKQRQDLTVPAVVAEVDSRNTFMWTVPYAASGSIKPVVAEEKIELQEMPVPIDRQDTVNNLPAEQTLAEHMVQAGETLYSIAKQHRVGVMDLVSWNNLSLQDALKTGQVLVVKNAQPVTEINKPASTEITYQVKASDTLYSVARQYGVTIRELMDWNQKKDLSITVGEYLRILKK